MNIIFDVGGVILNWDPVEIIKSFFPEEENPKEILNKLIQHEDWANLDKGVIEQSEAVRNMAERTDFEEQLIEDFFDHSAAYLSLKEDTLTLIEELKVQNHELYVLSNMHLNTIDCLKTNFSFWDSFKGIVFSAEVKMIKPDREIYQHILEKYSLEPENTIFIDDMSENVEAANRLGIHGILFKDAKTLKSQLADLLI
ncbi:MAG: HAD family phosphatase [Spirochaetales bacterium]|nr:HAD family phosphatase [Spirochaetales bacterium]